MGLRTKSALVLLGSVLLVLAVALLAGWRALEAVEENLGRAYARNATLLNKQRLVGPVLRELALSQRLADLEITREFLLDEDNPEKRRRFFAEAERFRQAFDDKSYFLISAISRRYYFNDRRSPVSHRVRYELSTTESKDAWFFNSLKKTEDFNVNVDPDPALKATKVWFNVIVRDGQRKVGVAGSGLELTTFLNRFITSETEGVTPMVLNARGAIQAHPDSTLIDYASVNDKGTSHSTIYRLLDDEKDRLAFANHMREVAANPENVVSFWSTYRGHPELLSLAYIPQLQWYVVTAVDLKAARVVDPTLWLPLAGVGLAVLLLLVGIIMVSVNRLLLTPVLRLTTSVGKVAQGQYDLGLPAAGRDELGELTRAVQRMAHQVREHTEELERLVSERTSELMTVNQRMAAANQQIGDSIQYASLIQNAILPAQDLAQERSGQYFVLWRPRDVVGGDFYVYRATEKGCLLGVWDCAGHGVPGAFMTMMAYAALNAALDNLGPQDPAAVLTEVDRQVRALLLSQEQAPQAATNMDAGLVFVDFEASTLTFAGAKVSLYCCDGASVSEIKGARHVIGGKKVPAFKNEGMALNGAHTYYLTTDGFLDQAGGEKGYSFGQARFTELMLRHASRPVEEQGEAFAAELDAYRGELAQRDDITLLSFRFTTPGP